jgi:hypothetical protein
MTIYLAHYVHLNEKQKICIPEVPDFDGYHYQESIIAKELKSFGRIMTLLLMVFPTKYLEKIGTILGLAFSCILVKVFV